MLATVRLTVFDLIVDKSLLCVRKDLQHLTNHKQCDVRMFAKRWRQTGLSGHYKRGNFASHIAQRRSWYKHTIHTVFRGRLSPAFRKKQTMSDGKPSIIQRFRLKAALVYSRNVILCFLLALMCGVSVFACGRSRYLYVNEKMRRSELVRLGVDRQREVFRQCSPEVKARNVPQFKGQGRNRFPGICLLTAQRPWLERARKRASSTLRQ